MRSRISSKGQVTVPKEVRDAMGLKAGDAVAFTVHDGQAVLTAAKAWTVDDLSGFLKGYGKARPVPKEKYQKTVAKALAQRDQRSKRR